MDWKQTAISKSLSGLVMAGGQSRRMGQNKASLNLGDGPSFLELACAKVASLTPFWHVSCAKGKPIPPWPCLEDRLENFGPLAGILAGLENALSHSRKALLVLACDLPLMQPELLHKLVAAHFSARKKPLLTVWENTRTGYLEMQAAVYDVQSLSFFQEAARMKRKKLRSAIPEAFQLRLACPPESEWNFLNCNRPEDLQMALEIVQKK